MTPRRFLLLCFAIALAATGCTNTDTPTAGSAPTTTAPTAKAAPPPDGGTYETAADVIAALDAADFTCTGYEEVAGATGALTRGACSSAAGNETVISIYGSAADAQAHPDVMAELLRGLSEVNVVVGRNWTISCETQEDCVAVDQALGGQSHHIPK